MSEQSLDNLTTNELTPALDAVSDGRSGDVVSSSTKACVLTSEQVRAIDGFCAKGKWILPSDGRNLCETIADRDREIAELRRILDAETECLTCSGTGTMGGDCGSCAALGYATSHCGVCHGTGHWFDECGECDGGKRSFRDEATRQHYAALARTEQPKETA